MLQGHRQASVANYRRVRSSQPCMTSSASCACRGRTCASCACSVCRGTEARTSQTLASPSSEHESRWNADPGDQAKPDTHALCAPEELPRVSPFIAVSGARGSHSRTRRSWWPVAEHPTAHARAQMVRHCFNRRFRRHEADGGPRASVYLISILSCTLGLGASKTGQAPRRGRLIPCV